MKMKSEGEGQHQSVLWVQAFEKNANNHVILLMQHPRNCTELHKHDFT